MALPLTHPGVAGGTGGPVPRVHRSLSHLACLGQRASWEDGPTGRGQTIASHSQVWTGLSVGRSGPAQDLARLWLLGAGVPLRQVQRQVTCGDPAGVSHAHGWEGTESGFVVSCACACVRVHMRARVCLHVCVCVCTRA